MEERLVRQIEQIVDQQPVPGVEEFHAVDACPLLVGHPRDVRKTVEVGRERIPHPDPDPRAALGDRSRADPCPRRDPVLAGHVRTSAIGCEAQAVVAALDLVAAQRAGRQRVAAVRAPVVQADHGPVRRAIQHDRLPAHRAPDRVRADLGDRCGDVPVALRIGHRPAPFIVPLTQRNPTIRTQVSGRWESTLLRSRRHVQTILAMSERSTPRSVGSSQGVARLR